MQSTMVMLTGGMLWVWLVAQVMRLVSVRPPEPAWLLLSLMATISFSGIAGGTSILTAIKQKLQYTIAGVGLLSIAVAPLVGTLSECRSPSGAPTTWTDPVLWTWIVAAEALVAALLVIWAWRAWPEVELG